MKRVYKQVVYIGITRTPSHGYPFSMNVGLKSGQTDPGRKSYIQYLPKISD